MFWGFNFFHFYIGVYGFKSFFYWGGGGRYKVFGFFGLSFKVLGLKVLKLQDYVFLVFWEVLDFRFLIFCFCVLGSFLVIWVHLVLIILVSVFTFGFLASRF